MAKAKKGLKKSLAVFVAAMLVLCSMWGMTALAAESVDYIDGNGNQQSASCVSVTEDDTEWADQWYVVDSDVTASERIIVSGTVHLVLADGCTLTAEAGVGVSSGNTLVIYGQAEGTGKLVATGSTSRNYGNDAGIGGSFNSEKEDIRSAGTITINGGVIEATGATYSAGIGGAADGKGGTITINGGTVTAVGKAQSAGIGGGRDRAAETITINGGTVDATGGAYAAGIGGGYHCDGGEITINGGEVSAKTNTTTSEAAAIGGGSGGNTGKVTINGGTVTAQNGKWGAGIGNGRECRTNGTNEITINGGVVDASSKYYGAGIGTGYYSYFNGAINITGGMVTATGGEGASGIGNGYYKTSVNEINISGGYVEATGGVGASGIGSADQSYHTGPITITAGTVVADGSLYGISSPLSTSANGCAVIYASSLEDSDEELSGVISTSSITGPAVIYNSPVRVTADEQIPAGKYAIIEAGKTLTIGSGSELTNNGTVYQDYSSIFNKNGGYVDNGETYYEVAQSEGSNIAFASGTIEYNEKEYSTYETSLSGEALCTVNTYSEDEGADTSVEVANETFVMPDEPVIVAAHKVVIAPAVDPTCTEPGLTEGSYCEVCGEIIEPQEEIPATGHTPGEKEYIEDSYVAPTETEDGSVDWVIRCEVCGEILDSGTEIIPATGVEEVPDDEIPDETDDEEEPDDEDEDIDEDIGEDEDEEEEEETVAETVSGGSPSTGASVSAGAVAMVMAAAAAGALVVSRKKKEEE